MCPVCLYVCVYIYCVYMYMEVNCKPDSLAVQQLVASTQKMLTNPQLIEWLDVVHLN